MRISFTPSHQVEAPPEHQAEALVTITRQPNGTEFDWKPSMGAALFKIRQSWLAPDNDFLAKPYRDHWFYFADNDLELKSTFMHDAVVPSARRLHQIDYPRPDDPFTLRREFSS